MVSFIFLTVSLLLGGAASAFDATAWQSSGGSTNWLPWPENEYLEDGASPDRVGMTLSGGGDRAFIASIGYLSALHGLGLMSNITYLVGVSGGAWATAVYSYYQFDDVSDETMLGPVLYPQNITYALLGDIDAGCVRSFVNSSDRLGGPTYDDWADFVQLIYLDPSGVDRGAPFSYNAESVADIKSRNPSLGDVDFVLPRGPSRTALIDKRPFPIMSTTLIGPYDMLPSMPSNRNYTLLEFTPLSTGVAFSQQVTYGLVDSTESTIFPVVGGLVETFAFNGDAAPETGLLEGEPTGSLDVPPFSPLTTDLALAIGSSSWAVGASIAASDNPLVQQWSGTIKYWAPSAGDETEDYFAEYVIADGAGVSNTNLISLLQRNVSKIFAFVSTSVPMQNSSHWNPATDVLSKESIDFTVPAWFGQIAVDLGTIDMASYDLNNSQIFASEEWVPFATALQDAQAQGSGNIIKMQHKTVQNRKYGLEAGRSVTVVWFYLGRCLEWESQLSEEMQSLVVPESDPANQASLRRLGPFAKFPHYTTAVASLDNEQANLLADLTGWAVLQHADLFESLLAAEPDDDDGGGTGSGNSNDSDVTFAESTTGILVIVFSVAGAALFILLATVYYQRFVAADDSYLMRKDQSLASQDTLASGRESEMISSFTRLP